MNHEIRIKSLWKVELSHNFNSVVYGQLFNSDKKLIAVGGEDGIVHVYGLPETNDYGQNINSTLTYEKRLEAKCGSILHLLLYDLARLSPNDLIVADNRGSVIFFFDGQILDRSLETALTNNGVTSVAVLQNRLNSVNVVCGKENGEITCFNTFTQLWKLQLNFHDNKRLRNRVSVTCLLETNIKLSTCNKSMNYLLAGDSNGCIHAIQDGVIRKTIVAGSVVNTMAVGNFLTYEEPEFSMDTTDKPTQIALGCSDGFVLLLVDLEINRENHYADVGHPLTFLHKIPNQDDSAKSSNVDYLVCCGHYPSLKVYQDGKEKNEFPLTSWPVTVYSLAESTKKPSRFDLRRLLVGCYDKNLQLIEIL